MDIKEAVAVITGERDRHECDGTLTGLLREAYDMAIVALDMVNIAMQMQEGALSLDNVREFLLDRNNSKECGNEDVDKLLDVCRDGFGQSRRC